MPHPAMLVRAAASKEEARARLLAVALDRFANQGFRNTSTRELAEAAKVNVAAISYYFGDKAGLYRAVFFESHGHPDPDPAVLSDPAASLSDALQSFFGTFLEPLRHGPAARLCMKLRLREMFEPTGLGQEEIATSIEPLHDALVGVLARHVGCDPDDDLQRLAVCITAMGVQLHVARDVIDEVAPALNRLPDAVDRWGETLVQLALAMVDSESQRRRALAPPAPGAAA